MESGSQRNLATRYGEFWTQLDVKTKTAQRAQPPSRFLSTRIWLRGLDLNQRPSGYEPDELPDCSTPRKHHSECADVRQTAACLGDLQAACVNSLKMQLFQSSLKRLKSHR